MSLGNGRRRYIYSDEEREVRVNDVVTKCVAFVGEVLHVSDAHFDGDLVGTGFFVQIETSIQGRAFHCFVTAKHVIEDLDPSQIYIQVNTRGGGGLRLICGDDAKWWFHPTDADTDVAVLPISVASNLDVASVGVEMFLTEERLRDYRIGIGDEVFVTGLFTPASGTNRNYPIVRHGNVARIADEPIRTKMGDVSVYLVEARSIGGISGSPVFVRETVQVALRTPPGTSPNKYLHGVGRMLLMGLMYGHWDTDPEEINSPRVTGEGVNVGIAIVIPATKIIETINHPELVEMRRMMEREYVDSVVLPKADSARATEHERFKALATQVLSVPKSEIDKRDKEFKARKRKKRR